MKPSKWFHRELFLRSVLALVSGVITFEAGARPEYALRIGQNRCTQCHFSPAGGGPKNLNGKYFGTGNYQLNPLSRQEYAGADIKGLYNLPERHSEARGGAGVMAVNIYASIPLVPLSEKSGEIRVVGEHNLGGFGAGQRFLYLRWKYFEDTESRLRPQYLVLGRFLPPFGLMFDEHRPYVRLQTNTPWNTGFETGAMISGNPTDGIHYDLAVLNGQKNQGQINNGQATQWGGLINLRHQPTTLPLMMGLSASAHEKQVGAADAKSPWAASAYLAWSLHRSTGNRLPVTLMGEYARAKHWNASFTTNFVTDTAFATSVANSESEGVLLQANWDLGADWQLSYRYDRLALNKEFPDDAYDRHGVGLRNNFGPLMWWLIRFEKAEAGHPSESQGSKTGALDAAWAVLNVGI